MQNDMKPSACIIEARVGSIVCSRRGLVGHRPPWRDISWPEQMDLISTIQMVQRLTGGKKGRQRSLLGQHAVGEYLTGSRVHLLMVVPTFMLLGIICYRSFALRLQGSYWRASSYNE
jgi:hypothetical protein